MWKSLTSVGGFFVKVLTGGSLEKILDIIDKQVDTGVRQEEIKAEVIQTWIKAQTQLLVGRTWWFQLFFVIPLGIWFSAVCADSIFPGQWNIAALPAPLDEWAGWIIGALFLVDGGKALLGKMGK
jgi:hypothetical protein